MYPKRLFRAALLALLAPTGAATAADDYVTRKKIEPAAFDQLESILQDEMDVGGRFAYVETDERLAIDASLRRMRGLLAGKRTLAELDEDERVAVFNAQAQINAILTRRDGERVICDRRIIVGSHRKETFCETYADRMARIKYSRERMDELNKRVQACRELTVPGTAANSGGDGVLCRGG